MCVTGGGVQGVNVCVRGRSVRCQCVCQGAECKVPVCVSGGGV